MAAISFALAAHNEHVELEELLDLLNEYIRPEDEIILQLDSTATPEVMKVAEKYNVGARYEYHRIIYPLNGDFASFKNNLKKHCTRPWIFQLDADELLHPEFLQALPQILGENPTVELFCLPRINTVQGMTEEHIRRWGWRVDEEKRINWPDYQTRLVRNHKDLKWEGKVHERIVGFKSVSHFPFDNADWALHHPKTIEKQEQQNNFYNTL